MLKVNRSLAEGNLPMERREFIKRVGIYPIVVQDVAAALAAAEPAIRSQGDRQVVDLSGRWGVAHGSGEPRRE
jgi:hypothetical protein